MSNKKFLYEQVLIQIRFLTDYRTKLFGYLLILNTALITIVMSNQLIGMTMILIALVGTIGSLGLMGAEIRAVMNTSNCLEYMQVIEQDLGIKTDESMAFVFLKNSEFSKYKNIDGVSLLFLQRASGLISLFSWGSYTFFLFMSNRHLIFNT